MRLKRPHILALLIAFLVLSLAAIAQEKTKAKTGEEMEIVGLGFEKKKLAGAEITKATLIVRKSRLAGNGPAEKTQFDVILKSRIITNKDGEFTIEIPENQFKTIPQASNFELRLKIKPPKNFNHSYFSDETTTVVRKQDGPRYRLVLYWIPDRTKTNKGTFAVSSKAQT